MARDWRIAGRGGHFDSSERLSWKDGIAIHGGKWEILGWIAIIGNEIYLSGAAFRHKRRFKGYMNQGSCNMRLIIHWN